MSAMTLSLVYLDRKLCVRVPAKLRSLPVRDLIRRALKDDAAGVRSAALFGDDARAVSLERAVADELRDGDVVLLSGVSAACCAPPCATPEEDPSSLQRCAKAHAVARPSSVSSSRCDTGSAAACLEGIAAYVCGRPSEAERCLEPVVARSGCSRTMALANFALGAVKRDAADSAAADRYFAAAAANGLACGSREKARLEFS